MKKDCNVDRIKHAGKAAIGLALFHYKNRAFERNPIQQLIAALELMQEIVDKEKPKRRKGNGKSKKTKRTLRGKRH